MQVSCLKRWVCVKPLPLDTITKSGLLVDFMVGGEKVRSDGPFKGVLISYPQDRTLEGKVCLYDDLNGGFPLTLDGTDYFITKPKMVYAVLDGDHSVVQVVTVGVDK